MGDAASTDRIDETATPQTVQKSPTHRQLQSRQALGAEGESQLEELTEEHAQFGVQCATLIGAVFYTAQVIPYFALGTFIPTVLGALGISNTYAGGAAFNAFMLVGSGFGLWLIDKITRRQFLIGGFYLSAAILLFLVLARTPPLITVAAAAAFGFVLAGSSNLEFAYLPELFPTRLRASGVGVGTAASRIGSALSTFMLPICVESLGIRPTLGLCVGVLLAGGLICHAFAPETQGRSIEALG